MMKIIDYRIIVSNLKDIFDNPISLTENSVTFYFNGYAPDKILTPLTGVRKK